MKLNGFVRILLKNKKIILNSHNLNYNNNGLFNNYSNSYYILFKHYFTKTWNKLYK